MNKILNHQIQRQVNSKQIQNHIKPQKTFNEVLDTIVGQQEVKFSKHAMERLQSRNIQLNNNDVNRIKDALSKANKKGIKETLILMDNKAFVASVKNKTIITATMEEQLKDSVFSNIDGAVII